MHQTSLISIVIPIFNEEKNIVGFYKALSRVLSTLPYRFELIFVNDGSHDRSLDMLSEFAQSDPRIHILDFSRNFGKEIALTAGIEAARGGCVMMMDADLQHPPELVPQFISHWQQGAEVVIGIRQKSENEGLIKRVGTHLFYQLIRRISETELTPFATDYRLLDRCVVDAFLQLKEQRRMTRALIDWLGFRRTFISFDAPRRAYGQPTYSFWKLMRLAVHSIVALSFFPLKIVGYLGLFIVITSGPFGLYILLGKYVFFTPFASSFSGPAQLAFLLIFMVGVMMCALGLITLYVASIHQEVLRRPLYILRIRRPREEV